MVELDFFEDPRRFLAEAGEWLAGDPVVNTVVATAAERSAADDASGVDHGLPYRWWVIARDERGEVAGVAMRTAPFEPYPLYVLPMPDAAATVLARALHDRAERVVGLNGALPATERCAKELARLTGGTADVTLHTRLHRLDGLIAPAPTTGRLRAARRDEVDLAMEWFEAFAHDVDEQAGREPGSHATGGLTEEAMLRRIEQHQVWWWEDGGVPVHVTGIHPPAFGAVRLGPVYTPTEHRGRGYAANAVAQLSRRVLGAGDVPCLFTDEANPVSNRLYANLGYRPVVDMVELVVG